MKKQPKISLDYSHKPDRGYSKSVGADGYNFDSGHLAFGTFEDWTVGKARKNKRPNKPLF